MPSCPITICWKDVSFSVDLLWHLCGKLFYYVCVGSFLNSLFYAINIYVHLFANIKPCRYHYSLKISFEMRYGTSFNIVLLENCSGFPRSIIFPSDFRVDINFYQKKKKISGIFIEIVSTLKVNLGKNCCLKTMTQSMNVVDFSIIWIFNFFNKSFVVFCVEKGWTPF